jgi:nucleoside-diphosphate-sugar epimerase
MNFLKQASVAAGSASAAISKKASEIDKEYGISVAANDAAAKASAKITEVDTKLGISEGAGAAAAAVKTKAQQVDKEYGLSDKANAAGTAVKSKAREADSKLGISEGASKLDAKLGASDALAKTAAAAAAATAELSASYVAGASLPPPPTAAELQAYGMTPGRCGGAALGPAAGKVCVTGATGFIALWLVSQLLEKGYTVVATVRSRAKIGPLETLAAQHVGDSGESRLTIVDGCDLMRAGSFDAAVAGCVGVFHTASPFYPAKDSASGISELVVPAVVGTRAVLAAAQRAGCVQRVVLTSSFACMFNVGNADFGPDFTYTDSTWNVSSFPGGEAGAFPAPGEGMHAYRYSKLMAEKTAWDAANAIGEYSFDVVAINPPLVLGPRLDALTISDPSQLNESSLIVYKWLTTKPQFPSNGMAFVDVTDVAAAHVLVYQTPAAGGNRYLTSAPAMLWADVAATLKNVEACGGNPNLPIAPAASGVCMKMDTSRLEALGMTWIPGSEAVKRQVQSLLEMFPALATGGATVNPLTEPEPDAELEADA